MTAKNQPSKSERDHYRQEQADRNRYSRDNPKNDKDRFWIRKTEKEWQDRGKQKNSGHWW